MVVDVTVVVVSTTVLATLGALVETEVQEPKLVDVIVVVETVTTVAVMVEVLVEVLVVAVERLPLG